MASKRFPIAFGGGLDRYTGSMAVQPTAFEDLRNVHLRNGGCEVRGGLEPKANLLGETALIGVYPIRALGIGALITWRASDQLVRLYLVSADASTTSLVGTVWDTPIAPMPRVVCADSYNRLFIAHEEPLIARRQPTMVYDPNATAPDPQIAPIPADLDGDGTAAPVRFRGVTRHLNYLIGWGYGTESETDRPEIVRTSLPADPLTFEGAHYWIAGQRGEPVMHCLTTGNVLAVLKETERYTIVGYDRASFGIVPADLQFGVVAPRLAAVIGGVVYFWSHAGPRRCAGGEPSEDLALPLDLDGPSPDALADDPDTANGFTSYDPERRELTFHFGRWGYTLHLGEPGAERWSYRQYGVQLACAGLLYAGGSTLGPGAVPVSVTATPVDFDSVTVEWDTDQTGGTLTGNERYEICAKPATTGVWALAKSEVLAGPGHQAITVDGLLPGVAYVFAVRYKLNGIATPGYASDNADTWPASARSATVTTPLPQPVISGTWARTGAATYGFTLHTAPKLAQPHVRTRWEFSTDGGNTWALVPGSPAAYGEADATHDTTAIAYGATIRYRATYETDWATGTPGTADLLNGVPAPATVSATSDLFTECAALVHVEATARDIPGGVLHVELDISEIGTGPADGTTQTFSIDYTCGNPVTPRARHSVTAFGVTDYSDYTIGTPITPPCNPGVPC